MSQLGLKKIHLSPLNTDIGKTSSLASHTTDDGNSHLISLNVISVFFKRSVLHYRPRQLNRSWMLL